MATKYADAVAAWVLKAQGNTDQATRKIVLDVGTSLVMRSPVGDPTKWKSVMAGRKPPKGYVGGRFRANWQYGNYSGAGIPMTDLPDIDRSGGASLARIAAGIPQKASGLRHVLINNLPYAMALERGHSQQAPAGMVGLALIEFQSIVQAAAMAVRK